MYIARRAPLLMSIHIASLIKHSQILAYNIYFIRKLMISLPVFLEKFEASLGERENKYGYYLIMQSYLVAFRLVIIVININI